MSEHQPAIGLSSAGRHTLCMKDGEPWPCRTEREADVSAGADPEPHQHGPWIRDPVHGSSDAFCQGCGTAWERAQGGPSVIDATRLRNWIAEHRKTCPVMRESARELFDALNDEARAALPRTPGEDRP